MSFFLSILLSGPTSQCLALSNPSISVSVPIYIHAYTCISVSQALIVLTQTLLCIAHASEVVFFFF